MPSARRRRQRPAPRPVPADDLSTAATAAVANWERRPGTWAAARAAFIAQHGETSESLTALGSAFRAARLRVLAGDSAPTPPRLGRTS